MKGQVRITIKNPQGEIVKEVNQTNRVFDIPKIIMTEMFPLTIQNYWKCSTTNTGSASTSYTYNYLSVLTNIKDWFRSIKINDEFFEEDQNGNIVDNAYKDWKIPQLYGSENTTKTNPSNDLYTSYNLNYSSENNNLKKVYYSWTASNAFKLRSINLCHYDAVGRNTTNVNNVSCYRGQINSSDLIWKYGNFYFGYDYSVKSSYQPSYIASSYETLFKNPSYSFSDWRFNYTKHLAVINDYGDNGRCIFPLYNDEILLLRRNNDITTDGASISYSGYTGYVDVISNDTGDLKRQFHITQFQDMGVDGYDSSYRYYPSSWDLNVISLANGKNFLIQYANYKYGATSDSIASHKKTVKYRIWEIPSTQNTLPVACVGTVTADTTVVEGKEYYTIAYDSFSIPGELVDANHNVYTLVENPTGNPKTKGYYEVVKGTNGTIIPYIETTGLESKTNNYMSSSYVINNKFFLFNYILTFNNDSTITTIQRYINNCGTSISSTSYDGNYIGRNAIPNLKYGLANIGNSSVCNFPIWYNTSCVNINKEDDGIDIPQGYTLTVEYTITAN